jgi:Protein of unknown function (DUF4231)
VSSKRAAKPVPFDVAKVEDLITSRKLPPDDEQYLRERWLERIRWWDHRATTSRRKFLTSRCIVVVGGVLIPFLTSEAVRLPGNDFLNYVATFVALLVAASAALEALFNWGGVWLKKRRAAELLKVEGWLFLHRAGHYRDAESTFATFVSAVESRIGGEIGEYLAGQEPAKQK